MLRRTFFKLLAALPFVGKAKDLHFSKVNKPEDWTTCSSAGSMWIWEVKPSGEPLTIAAIERWHNEYRSLQTWNRRHHAIITNIKVVE